MLPSCWWWTCTGLTSFLSVLQVRYLFYFWSVFESYSCYLLLLWSCRDLTLHFTNKQTQCVALLALMLYFTSLSRLLFSSTAHSPTRVLWKAHHYCPSNFTTKLVCFCRFFCPLHKALVSDCPRHQNKSSLVTYALYVDLNCRTCDVTVSQTFIAVTMLKRCIVQPECKLWFVCISLFPDTIDVHLQHVSHF